MCFWETRNRVFGHIVSKEGVKVDPSKIHAIANWPIPKNIKGLRGFLDHIG
jgi:hypothetical protein